MNKDFFCNFARILSFSLYKGKFGGLRKIWVTNWQQYSIPHSAMNCFQWTPDGEPPAVLWLIIGCKVTNKWAKYQIYLSPRALRDYRNEGILPYIRMKGNILYRESDVEKVLKGNEHRVLSWHFERFTGFLNNWKKYIRNVIRVKNFRTFAAFL